MSMAVMVIVMVIERLPVKVADSINSWAGGLFFPSHQGGSVNNVTYFR